MGHELYCAGHLIQAAVALHRAGGHTGLLEVARWMADLIVDNRRTESRGADHIGGRSPPNLNPGAGILHDAQPRAHLNSVIDEAKEHMR
jgi:hypothetical protein